MKYYGIIKTKAQAQEIAQKLRENGSEKAIGAAQMLEHNWQSIAARPAIQPEIIAMAETTPLYRAGGIMSVLIG